eukprot:Rhum_TRINITY_DN15185_c25_g1::Rhum_TRINITY_DN15185_c25_g1_i1::g.143034::m.143034
MAQSLPPLKHCDPTDVALPPAVCSAAPTAAAAAAAASSASDEAPLPPARKLLMFDFDQTLASIHVYHCLDAYLEEDVYENANTEEEGVAVHKAEQLRLFDEVFAAHGEEQGLEMIYGSIDRLESLRRFLRAAAAAAA